MDQLTQLPEIHQADLRKKALRVCIRGGLMIGVVVGVFVGLWIYTRGMDLDGLGDVPAPYMAPVGILVIGGFMGTIEMARGVYILATKFDLELGNDRDSPDDMRHKVFFMLAYFAVFFAALVAGFMLWS